MNPYSPLFLNASDQLTVWGMAVLSFWGVTSVAAEWSTEKGRFERGCLAVAATGSILSVAAGGNFLVGWVFLMKLKVVSPFWFFWELGYLLSVILVFQVLPFFTAGAVVWSAWGKWKGRYGGGTIRLAWICMISHVIAAGMYVLLTSAAE